MKSLNCCNLLDLGLPAIPRKADKIIAVLYKVDMRFSISKTQLTIMLTNAMKRIGTKKIVLLADTLTRVESFDVRR